MFGAPPRPAPAAPLPAPAAPLPAPAAPRPAFYLFEIAFSERSRSCTCN